MSEITPQPVVLQPIFKAKVWGGRRLESLGKPLPAGEAIGESWEVADLSSTDPGGGGGGAARSVIARGPLAGRTLHDAIAAWGGAMLGEGRSAGDFPLLVKFLDAREHLSVQVHPSPEYARTHPGAHLKTECWFVLAAEADAVIFKGVRAGVTREAFERALRTGEGAGVVDLLDAVPARVGDMHLLPSGTVHALGAGVLVAEVQTPSDTTFRVYDWAKEYGRAGRELHVEQAMACIDFSPAAGATRLGDGAKRGVLCTTDFFRVEEVRGHCEETLLVAGGSRGPVVVMCLSGMGMSIAGEGFNEVQMRACETAVVPAACAAKGVLRMGPQTRVLAATLGG
ncbi:MAG: class I mannose-6-phosphate isomerase [Phycisphaerales bacterium]|jgi:mannose-6-phosphate isomerase|nr:class I mannose-6-phosphate isomerase [Phycisphaerales bacterium]